MQSLTYLPHIILTALAARLPLLAGIFDGLKDAIFGFLQTVVNDNALSTCLICLVIAGIVWPLSTVMTSLTRYRGMISGFFLAVIGAVLFFNNWSANLDIQAKLTVMLHAIGMH